MKFKVGDIVKIVNLDKIDDYSGPRSNWAHLLNIPQTVLELGPAPNVYLLSHIPEGYYCREERLQLVASKDNQELQLDEEEDERI